MSAPGAPAPGGNPEELLMQIAMLMEQYLAMGEQTPAFGVVSQALPEIQAAAGGGGGAPPMAPGPNEPPPEALAAAMAGGGGGEPPMMMSGETPMPDMTGAPGGDYGSFGEADAALIEDIKKKRPRQ